MLERLPAYAPELNPVEYLFGYLKQRELANLCLDTIADVKAYARRRLRSVQRGPFTDAIRISRSSGKYQANRGQLCSPLL